MRRILSATKQVCSFCYLSFLCHVVFHQFILSELDRFPSLTATTLWNCTIRWSLTPTVDGAAHVACKD